MSPTLKKQSSDHDDLTFMKTLYHTSIKDLLEMDETLLSSFLSKTQAVYHWLEGIQTLARSLKKEGN